MCLNRACCYNCRFTLRKDHRHTLSGWALIFEVVKVLSGSGADIPEADRRDLNLEKIKPFLGQYLIFGSEVELQGLRCRMGR
jgi:hypothetical protein